TGIILLISIVLLKQISLFADVDLLQSSFVWTLPIAVFFTGIYQALINWNIRIKEFKGIAMTQFYRTTSIVTGQVGSGIVIGNSFTLILSHIIGQIIAVCTLLKDSWRKIHEQKDKISFKNIKKQLVRYRNFTIYYS